VKKHETGPGTCNEAMMARVSESLTDDNGAGSDLAKESHVSIDSDTRDHMHRPNIHTGKVRALL